MLTETPLMFTIVIKLTIDILNNVRLDSTLANVVLWGVANLTSSPNSGQFGVGLSWLCGLPPEETRSMRGKRFTEEQITYALRRAEGGTTSPLF